VARAARLILTVHDVAYLRHPEFYGSKRWNDYGYRYLLGNSLRRADLVIAISQATSRDLTELCNVPPEKIWVVPSGVDPRLAPVTEEQRLPVLTRLAIDRPYVMYPIGTIDLRKNLERTFRAFRSAFPEPAGRPLLLLTGVGSPPQEIESLARDLDLAQDVRTCHVGYPDDLAALLSGARWGMYLSLYEGFGLPPLEAMACGLPLVVSNVSSIPEVVGDTAILVDPRGVEAMAAAMRRLEDDEDLRSDLAARGRERAASPAFSWERAARQTAAAYRNDREAFLAEEQPVSPG
jgi:alpha-1,3-rhamnosyl/mannosyltransferase